MTDEPKKHKEAYAMGLNMFPTIAEKTIRAKLLEMGFEQNKVVFGYIPDFSNKELKLAIEIDGSVHDTPGVTAKDKRKDEVFKINGWKVLRFTNALVIYDMDYVMERIWEEVRYRQAFLPSKINRKAKAK